MHALGGNCFYDETKNKENAQKSENYSITGNHFFENEGVAREFFFALQHYK